MKQYLIRLARYNEWANLNVVKWIEEAGEEASVRVHTGSFPSVRETVFHIWGAQELWLNRLNGISLTEWTSGKNIASTLEGARKLVVSSTDLIRWIEQANQSLLTTPLAYRTLKGDAYTNTPEEILAHVFNHSTYHRGQVVNLLRASGFTHVTSTDLVAFFRM